MGELLAGPGARPVRAARRVNVVLTAVRGLVTHAVATGTAPAGLVSLVYEVGDETDLPEEARREDGRIPWRLRGPKASRRKTSSDASSDISSTRLASCNSCSSALPPPSWPPPPSSPAKDPSGLAYQGHLVSERPCRTFISSDGAQRAEAGSATVGPSVAYRTAPEWASTKVSLVQDWVAKPPDTDPDGAHDSPSWATT